jgi:hypothetical protein
MTSGVDKINIRHDKFNICLFREWAERHGIQSEKPENLISDKAAKLYRVGHVVQLHAPLLIVIWSGSIRDVQKMFKYCFARYSTNPKYRYLYPAGYSSDADPNYFFRILIRIKKLGFQFRFGLNRSGNEYLNFLKYQQSVLHEDIPGTNKFEVPICVIT